MKISELLLEEIDIDKADRDFVPPKKTIKAYKLFKVKQSKPGKLFALYVNPNDEIELGKWYVAKVGKPSPEDNTKVDSLLGALANRPGWHGGHLPVATHIGANSVDPVTGKITKVRRPNEVWAEVEFPADVDWQKEANRRALRMQSDSPVTGLKKGDIRPDTAHITDQPPYGGYYKYKTNPNMAGEWIIAGALKVNRILSDEEVIAINKEAGTSDLPRKTPFNYQKYGFKK